MTVGYPRKKKEENSSYTVQCTSIQYTSVFKLNCFHYISKLIMALLTIAGCCFFHPTWTYKRRRYGLRILVVVLSRLHYFRIFGRPLHTLDEIVLYRCSVRGTKRWLNGRIMCTNNASNSVMKIFCKRACVYVPENNEVYHDDVLVDFCCDVVGGFGALGFE